MLRNYRFFFFLTICLSFIFSNVVFSDNKENDRDYFLNLQQAEKKLSAKELYELARLYIYGIGTKKDPSQALLLLERSAKLGSSDALNMLGILYRDGLGTEKNHHLALRYFYAAAEKDNTFAQYNLGMYYYKGRNIGTLKRPNMVDRDYEKAIHWLKIASNKGYAYAQTQLGICYYSGKGFPRVDYIKAAHLFHLSANQGNILAIYYLAKCFEHGNGVEQDYKKAFDLYYQASKAHGARFCYLIAFTNMVPDQIYTLLLIVNVLIALRYPLVTPIPFVNFYRGGQVYFFGRIILPILPALFIASLFVGIIGFSNEDKLFSFGIIHTFFYAFCSVKMQKIEMRSKRYKRKIKPKDTSPKDDFNAILSALVRFVKKRTSKNNK